MNRCATQKQAQTRVFPQNCKAVPYPKPIYGIAFSVIRYQGRVFVDAQDLARITNGSLSFEKNRIILTLPGSDGSSSSDETHISGFSRPFMKAAIEAMASIREWGGTLQAIVLNGYPVGNTTAGNTIMAFEGRAADGVALASAAASTESDHRGLELWTMGTKDADETIQACAAYTLAPVADRIRQDVLILAGTEDHFIPFHQTADFEKAFVNAHSVTTRIFDRPSGGAGHCQMGNLTLFHAAIFDWLLKKFPASPR